MLKTLDVSLQVLKMFTKEKPEWGGRELAHAMDIDHAKVYRILETFEVHNYIQKDPVTKKYSLGLAAWELGVTMSEILDVDHLLKPVLEELFHETGESVFLTILDKNEGVTLQAIEPDNKVKFSVSVGSRAPLYVGASYRSILAYMPETYIDNYIQTQEFIQHTENTITNPDKLRFELEKIKTQGWATSEGEYTPDIIAIAVPLFGKNDKIIGSITISGPIYRITDDKINKYLFLLKEARDKLAGIITKFPLKIRV